MKKSIKIISLTSLILVANCLSVEVFAANIDNSKKVQFGLSGDKTINKKPVVIPGATNIGTHSDFSGEVALTTIPKLTFDDSNMENRKVLIDAKGSSGETPGIRIDDVSGKGAGWTVRVKASEFVSTTDNSVKLNGAKLIFPQKDPVSFANTISKKPVVSSAEVPFDGEPAEYKLMEAGEGAGMGAWEVAYEGNSKIQMELPAGQLLGTYKATVTYSLTVGQLGLDNAQ